MLDQRYELLLCGAHCVLHLVGDTLLVDGAFIFLDAFGILGFHSHVALEFHGVLVHLLGLGLVVCCREEGLERERARGLLGHGVSETGLNLSRMVARRPVYLSLFFVWIYK